MSSQATFKELILATNEVYTKKAKNIASGVYLDLVDKNFLVPSEYKSLDTRFNIEEHPDFVPLLRDRHQRFSHIYGLVASRESQRDDIILETMFLLKGHYSKEYSWSVKEFCKENLFNEWHYFMLLAIYVTELSEKNNQ